MQSRGKPQDGIVEKTPQRREFYEEAIERKRHQDYMDKFEQFCKTQKQYQKMINGLRENTTDIIE